MDTSTKETVFYQDSNVLVTQTRFVSQGKTYAIHNISSVSIRTIARSKKLEIFMIVIGAIMLVAESTLVIGILLLVIAVAMLFLLKDSYSVRINSNSGEADGLISKDREYITSIVNAVNDAIIHRG